MKKQRKHYSAEEKVAILRQHLVEEMPVSELCDKQGLQPTVFYRWKDEAEQGAPRHEVHVQSRELHHRRGRLCHLCRGYTGPTHEEDRQRDNHELLL